MPAKKVPAIEGKTFGRLTVVSLSHDLTEGGRRRRWFAVCHCSCGATATVLVTNLREDCTQSCGCLQRARAAIVLRAIRLTHGEGHSRLYYVWYGMKRRCNDPNAISYKRYGARGISVCSEWDDFTRFRDWALSHGYRSGLTLERRDNQGNYEPSNCEWATKKVQAHNTRRNHWIEAFGERKVLIDWVRDPRCCVDHGTLHYRLSKGWAPELAITAASYGHYQRQG